MLSFQKATRKGLRLTMFALLAMGPCDARADSEETFWLGYMSNWWLNPSQAIWFDTHLNHDTFFVLRGGYTHRFESGPSLTGGYAYLRLNPDLERQEHRPWGQLFLPFRLNDEWTASFRLRSELRFLESLDNGQPASGYDFAWRNRFQTSFTRRFEPVKLGTPLLQFSHELLLNFVSNPELDTLDQNRLSIMVGLEMENLTIRIGYMNRYLANINDGTTEHAALLWFTQNVQIGDHRRSRTEIDYDDFPEQGSP